MLLRTRYAAVLKASWGLRHELTSRAKPPANDQTALAPVIAVALQYG
jgi:hypothetical protein